MKKKLLRLCSIVLVISMVLGNLVSLAADDTTSTGTEKGMEFSTTLKGVIENPFDSNIKTVEATICLPKELPDGVSNYSGVILGMYGISDTEVGLPCLSFEIYTGGYPCVYYYNQDADETRVVFNKNITKGEVTHLAFVLNESDSGTIVSCYVNGEAVAPMTAYPQLGVTFEKPTIAYCVGGDYRTDPTNSWFKGEIYSVAAYSEARAVYSELDALSDEEKAALTEADINERLAIDTSNTGLMAYYDLTTVDDSTTEVANGSANDTDNTYGLNIIETWMDTRRPALNEEDIAYSIALVGDTQIATEYDVYYKEDETKEKVVAGIYDWLLENKEEKNIEFVIGLGDIVQGESTYALDRSITKDADAQEAEWVYAMEQIHTLDGEIPYSLIRGNHDTQQMYNKYVTQAGHGNVIDGALDGTMLNTWQELVVGDIKYLIMSLDLGASDTELKWAEEVIKTHPNHNVIISTHAYLNDDGTTLDASDGDFAPANYYSTAYPDATHNRNNGDEMWDNYFKKYDNIVMIVSGHIGSDDIIMTPAYGDNNNKVVQMLVDPQSLDNKLVKAGDTPTGMICLLNFSADGKSVQVEQYSTANGQWYMSTSQMTFGMNVIEDANQKLNFNHAQLMTKDLASSTDATKTRQFGYNYGACATTNAQVIVSAGYTNVISYCAPSDGLIKITDMEVGYYNQDSTTERVVEFAVTDESGRILTNRGDVLTLKTADAKYTYSGLSMETIEVEQGDCLYFVFHGVTGSSNTIYCYPNIQLSTDKGENWTTVSTSHQYYRVPWPANLTTYKNTNYEQGMGGFYYQYSTEYEKVDYQKPEYLYIEPVNMEGYRTSSSGIVDFPFMQVKNACMTNKGEIIVSAGYTNIIAYEAPEAGKICIDEMQVWITNFTDYTTVTRAAEFAVIDETGKILSNNGEKYTVGRYASYTEALKNEDKLAVTKKNVEKGEKIYFVFHGLAGNTNSLRCNAKILFSADGTTWKQVNTDYPDTNGYMTLYSSTNYTGGSESIDVATYQGKGNFYYQYSTGNTSDVDGIRVGDEKEGIVTVYEAPDKGETYYDKRITEVASDGTVEYIDLDMLNVKKQSQINSEDGTLTDVRFIASVDNLSYQEVGFLFTMDETIANDATQFVVEVIPDKANRPTTLVYTKMLESGKYRKASDIYADDGCNTLYGFAFEMTDIPANQGTIYVRAYVLLDDGETYVYGEPRAIDVTAAGIVN